MIVYGEPWWVSRIEAGPCGEMMFLCHKGCRIREVYIKNGKVLDKSDVVMYPVNESMCKHIVETYKAQLIHHLDGR